MKISSIHFELLAFCLLFILLLSRQNAKSVAKTNCCASTSPDECTYMAEDQFTTFEEVKKQFLDMQDKQLAEFTFDSVSNCHFFTQKSNLNIYLNMYFLLT